MKKSNLIFPIIVFNFFLSLVFSAAIISFKLPVKFGQSFIITQGYSVGTHIKKDSYAIDLTQSGCDAYGKEVLASADGTVVEVLKDQDDKETYGDGVKILHEDSIKSLYAHFKEPTFLKVGDRVKQGQVIGYIGNTGLKITSGACPEHPGTHLHFRVTQIQPDGSEIAYKPEPISGYTNLLAGNWYTSDNNLASNDKAPKVEKSKNWLARLWEKIKLAWNDTKDAVDNGDVKVQAIVANANVDQVVPKQNTPKPNDVVQNIQNNAVVVVPKNQNQVDVIAQTPPQIQVVLDQIINNNFVALPPPGFGGGAVPPPVPAVQQVVANNAVDKNQNLDILPIQTSPPTIISPINGSVFATSSVIFSGTSTPDSIVFAEGFDEIAVANNLGDWSLNLTLSQGTSTIQFQSIISGKSTSTPSIIEVYVDTIAPTISFALKECQYSLRDDSCLLPIATSTSIISTNELASIKLYRGDTVIGEVQGTTFNLETPLSIGQNNLYVVAVDGLGNQATSTVQNVEYIEKPVIINEIAWSGTDISPFNEWLEIYNRTDKNLNMSRFQISSKDGVPKVLLDGNLTPNGYYLIERTDDNSVPVVSASLVAPFSGDGDGSGLSDQGEELVLNFRLGDVSVVIDKTPSIDVCGGWCFDSPMGRVSPDSDGSIMSSWDFDPNIFEPIFKSKGIQIAGTPKAENFIHAVAQL